MATPKKATTPRATPKKATGSPAGEKRVGPSFNLVKIGAEKPAPEVSAKGPRRTAVIENLRAIQEDPGVWYEISQYATPSGAKNVIDALVAGKWELPEGDGEYDLDEHRYTDEDGKRRSTLIAQFVAG